MCIVTFLIFIGNFDKVGVQNCCKDPHPNSFYCEILGGCRWHKIPEIAMSFLNYKQNLSLYPLQEVDSISEKV